MKGKTPGKTKVPPPISPFESGLIRSRWLTITGDAIEATSDADLARFARDFREGRAVSVEFVRPDPVATPDRISIIWRSFAVPTARDSEVPITQKNREITEALVRLATKAQKLKAARKSRKR